MSRLSRDRSRGRRAGVILATAALFCLGTTGTVVLAPPEKASDGASEAQKLRLAVVEGEEITLADLQDSFGSRHFGHGGLLVGEEIIRTVLEKAIAERLLIHEGYRMGIPEEPWFQEAVAAKQDLLRLEALEKRFIEEAAEPAKEEVKRAYDTLPRQLRVSLIETRTKSKAQEALDRIRLGEAFEVVARQLSVHASRTQGGDLGWVTWGILDPETEEVAFSAKPGDLAGPFTAPGNSRILKVVEEKEADPPAFAAVEERIRAILKARRRTGNRRDLLASIRGSHPPEVDEAAVEKLLEGLPPAGDGQSDPPDETVLMKTATGLELTAGRVRGRARTKRASLPAAWQAASDDALMIDEARRRIPIDERIERQVEMYAEALIRDGVERDGVLRNLSLDDEEVKAYYDQNKSEFATPSSYHLRHILLATKPEAEGVKKALQEGADFAALARERSIDGASAPSGGDLGWSEAPQGGAPEAIRDLTSGEFSRVIETARGFAVVQLLEIKKGEAHSFEEVRHAAAERLMIRKQKELRDAFVGRLEQRASTKLYEKAIARAIEIQDEVAAARLRPEGQDSGETP